MIRDVPFYRQDWNLDDWKTMGFESRDDANYWKWSSCGVLCLKMAVDFFYKRMGRPESGGIVEYIRIGRESEYYSDNRGWSHQGLAEFARKFQLGGVNKENFCNQSIIECIDKGNLVLASVKTGFINKKNWLEKIFFWKKWGGHIVVVLGYKIVGGKIAGYYVHHTSVFPELNWENKFISWEKFKDVFTGRVVIISKNERNL